MDENGDISSKYVPLSGKGKDDEAPALMMAVADSKKDCCVRPPELPLLFLWSYSGDVFTLPLRVLCGLTRPLCSGSNSVAIEKVDCFVGSQTRPALV
ncbi:unnamed protein product [Effrenium voratum]|nr:unnamed protein product [Effrenium voratum]